MLRKVTQKIWDISPIQIPSGYKLDTLSIPRHRNREAEHKLQLQQNSDSWSFIMDYTYTSTHTPAYTYVHIHTCIHTCIHRYITQTHMHTYIKAHNTHTHTDTEAHQEQMPMKTTNTTRPIVITTIMIMYTAGKATLVGEGEKVGEGEREEREGRQFRQQQQYCRQSKMCVCNTVHIPLLSSVCFPSSLPSPFTSSSRPVAGVSRDSRSWSVPPSILITAEGEWEQEARHKNMTLAALTTSVRQEYLKNINDDIRHVCGSFTLQ